MKKEIMSVYKVEMGETVDIEVRPFGVAPLASIAISNSKKGTVRDELKVSRSFVVSEPLTFVTIVAQFPEDVHATAKYEIWVKGSNPTITSFQFDSDLMEMTRPGVREATITFFQDSDDNRFLVNDDMEIEEEAASSGGTHGSGDGWND